MTTDSKEKKTRNRRPLAERLKTMNEEKLRARFAAANAELTAIAEEAKRRMLKKVDLSDLTLE